MPTTPVRTQRAFFFFFFFCVSCPSPAHWPQKAQREKKQPSCRAPTLTAEVSLPPPSASHSLFLPLADILLHGVPLMKNTSPLYTSDLFNTWITGAHRSRKTTKSKEFLTTTARSLSANFKTFHRVKPDRNNFKIRVYFQAGFLCWRSRRSEHSGCQMGRFSLWQLEKETATQLTHCKTPWDRSGEETENVSLSYTISGDRKKYI